MHIDRIGSGPDLILLHGWAMHSGIFAPLVPHLAQRCTLHLVDLPGHGRSSHDLRLEPARIAGELAQMIPGAVWLGWSLGGLVCLEAARSHPEAIAGLALIATNPRFVATEGWPHGTAPAVFETFGRELGADYARTLDRFLALECHGSDAQRMELRELRRRVFEHGEPAAHVLTDGLHVLAESDYRGSVAGLSVPNLWIAGARDRLVPPAAMEWAAAQSPLGRFERIAGGGHAPFIGHPDRVMAAVDALLDEVAPSHASFARTGLRA